MSVPQAPGVTPVGAPTPKSEQPLRELLAELWENAETLLRNEVALARAELDQKGERLKAHLIAAALGGAVVFMGSACLTAALVLLLAEVMVAWLAALIVGAVMAIAGIVLLRRQPKNLLAEAVPERTIASMKKDVQLFTETKHE